MSGWGKRSKAGLMPSRNSPDGQTHESGTCTKATRQLHACVFCVLCVGWKQPPPCLVKKKAGHLWQEYLELLAREGGQHAVLWQLDLVAHVHITAPCTNQQAKKARCLSERQKAMMQSKADEAIVCVCVCVCVCACVERTHRWGRQCRQFWAFHLLWFGGAGRQGRRPCRRWPRESRGRHTRHPRSGKEGEEGEQEGGVRMCVCVPPSCSNPPPSLSLSLALSLSNPLTWMARAPISSAGMRPLSCLLRSVLIGVDGC